MHWKSDYVVGLLLMTVLADLRKGESAFCCVLASQGLGVETLLEYSFFRLVVIYVSILVCKSKVFLSIVAEQDDNFSLRLASVMLKCRVFIYYLPSIPYKHTTCIPRWSVLSPYNDFSKKILKLSLLLTLNVFHKIMYRNLYIYVYTRSKICSK